MTEVQEAMKKLRMDMPGLGVAITLSIRLHHNGALSVEGPVADPAFCKQLLDEAWETIKRNQKQESSLIVPACDVEVKAKEGYRQ